jgi:hypothetical protein
MAGKSEIHGDGVFAAAPIAEGERLMEFGGLPISRKDVATELYRTRSIWMVGDDAYLALPESDTEPSLDENLNHSCDANAWLIDEVTLSARRDIAAGEEITLDQGTWNFDENDYLWDRPACCCGSPDCRGRLGENDWKLAAVRTRYGEHFHPLIRKMMETNDR